MLSYTVTAARVHCILLWRGSVPAEMFKFTRQCMGADVLEKLTEFLYRYNVSRASSCRGSRYKVRRQRTGTGKTQFKTFWTCTRSSFQMKRTYIYTHLPTNFRMNTTLAGLSNICDDFGYSNLNELCTLIEGVCFHCPGLNGSTLKKLNSLLYADDLTILSSSKQDHKIVCKCYHYIAIYLWMLSITLQQKSSDFPQMRQKL